MILLTINVLTETRIEVLHLRIYPTHNEILVSGINTINIHSWARANADA